MILLVLSAVTLMGGSVTLAVMAEIEINSENTRDISPEITAGAGIRVEEETHGGRNSLIVTDLIVLRALIWGFPVENSGSVWRYEQDFVD